MSDLTPNLPDVVSEVRALFERYEQALVDKNVDVLDATFWDSPSRSATRSTSTATASRKSTPTALRGRLDRGRRRSASGWRSSPSDATSPP